MNENIECRATRRGRTWVAHVPEYGVYGHGRTLKQVRASVAAGLELVGVSAEVTVIPVTPELEELRSAEDAYTKALEKATAALALRRVTLTDISRATRTPVRQVKVFLAEGDQTGTGSTSPDHEAQPDGLRRR
ncbi:hypothetical protein [Streptomyces sp. MMS24-I29]|uniref:hypothetical protein n=1 Tax=Streptomyces sp. MMS24-I29 TaxID=3351480 RepID=UPI003C7D1C5E